MDELNRGISSLWREYADAASVANQDSPLLSLPREIRDIIWRYALIDAMQERHDKLQVLARTLRRRYAPAFSHRPYHGRPMRIGESTIPRAPIESPLSGLRPDNLLATCQLMRRECGPIVLSLMQWHEHSYRRDMWTAHHGDIVIHLPGSDRLDGRSPVHVYSPPTPHTLEITSPRLITYAPLANKNKRQRRAGRLTFAKELGWPDVVLVESEDEVW
ncbi:hypothetical protein BST61_g20 [Cercospora zeina]